MNIGVAPMNIGVAPPRRGVLPLANIGVLPPTEAEETVVLSCPGVNIDGVLPVAEPNVGVWM